MAQYTDDDIRDMKKITLQIAGQYLGIAPMAVALGMIFDITEYGKKSLLMENQFIMTQTGI